MPEVLSFFGSIIVFIVLRRASTLHDEVIQSDPIESGNQYNLEEHDHELGQEKWKLMLSVGKVLSLIALCATGALQPSIPSVIYYIVFLGAATWWGCNKELERCVLIIGLK